MLKINRKSKRFTRIDISLAAMSNNIRVLKSHLASKDIKIMAVVKSNAYGHGIREIANHAVKSGVNALGVVLAEDAIYLRKMGIKVPVYILGESPIGIIRDALKYDFTVCINSFEKARAVSLVCGKFGKKINVHIKVDTGMNRVGINHEKAVEEIEKIAGLSNLNIEGIFTHFSCAGEKSDDYTMMQWQRFQDVLKALEEKKIRFKIVHCANSAAFLRHKEFHCDMVRLGISMYGLSPFGLKAHEWLPPDIVKVTDSLKPLLSLKSRVSFVKKVGAGESVSYGATFTTSRPSIIATIPIGYADGYTRLYSNKAVVLVNGGLAPVIGNVTMDQIMADVTDIEDSSQIIEGTEVMLIGNSSQGRISADYLSSLIGTISYEVLCMLKDKIPRVYIY
jgi:alanine racemase